MEASPLILTLSLNEEAFLFFDRLRKQHFPTERNFLSAHLTLFHHLPSNETKILKDILLQTTIQSAFPLTVTDVVSIGLGVAFKIESQPLVNLHKQLQQKWQDWLIPQDKQKLWPHITV
ncbi:MAG: 2'-5' RNA ligase family protein, partial [Chitinophagaceae bacterium]